MGGGVFSQELTSCQHQCNHRPEAGEEEEKNKNTAPLPQPLTRNDEDERERGQVDIHARLVCTASQMYSTRVKTEAPNGCTAGLGNIQAVARTNTDTYGFQELFTSCQSNTVGEVAIVPPSMCSIHNTT